MIVEGSYKDLGGTDREGIEVDLSDRSHPNRVFWFLRGENPMSGRAEYQVRAKWTSDKYHPDLILDEAAMTELVDALIRLQQ